MTGPDHNSVPIGRRVAYWRARRNLSQQLFADRIGKSKSWVDKVERGVRRLDKWSVLADIADALRIDVGQLVTAAQGVSQTTAEAPPEVEQIRDVLTRYDDVDTTAHRPTTTGDLRKATAHAWLALQHGQLDRLLTDLPRLIVDTQRHRCMVNAGESALLMSQAYQITAALLRKVGEPHLAWVAADRAIAVSAATDDPLLAARAAVPLGGVVREMGQPRRGFELCVTVAHRLAPPDPLNANPEHLSVYGSLLLQAAMAAATLGDDQAVSELTEQAADAADRVGEGRNDYWTVFGPALVDGVRVATAVELGESGQAVAVHEKARAHPGYQQLPPGTRADHLVDAARGYAHTGDLKAAGRALLEADRIAPAEVRVRPAAREMLETVLRRSTQPDPLVVALADAAGVTGAR
ncbi:helix-turn-helix domain-containing protein [Micromonospora sp. NPDC000207]|uniref:helix-turn-helix domain-containing protein n=1 Tax=Micromonospora sp. NPDC000207 TaxID=3154246 RepID=UPI0033203660